MAILAVEMRNVQLVWTDIKDRVLVVLFIALSMGFASLFSVLLGYGPVEMYR